MFIASPFVKIGTFSEPAVSPAYSYFDVRNQGFVCSRETFLFSHDHHATFDALTGGKVH
jgi:hypothetical protein